MTNFEPVVRNLPTPAPITLKRKPVEARRPTFCLVAKAVTETMVRPQALELAINVTWDLTAPATAEEYRRNHFILAFQNEDDKLIAWENRPWNVHGEHILLQQWPEGVDLYSLDLNFTTFWVQIHDLPQACVDEDNVENLASRLGPLEKFFIDRGNIRDLKMHLRVNWALEKPLVHGFPLQEPGKEDVWIYLKYEKLEEFCLYCGRLGHGSKFCKENRRGVLIASNPYNHKAYGIWMRAKPSVHVLEPASVVNPLGSYRNDDDNGPSNKQRNNDFEENGTASMGQTTSFGVPNYYVIGFHKRRKRSNIVRKTNQEVQKVMGRRKQILPDISGVQEGCGFDAELNLENENTIVEKEQVVVENPLFVDIDGSSWGSEKHFDISEIRLSNLRVSEKFYGRTFCKEFYGNSKYFLRFKLSNVNQCIDRANLGHWPVFSGYSMILEFVEKHVVEGVEGDVVIVSGNFDGPDKGVSSLVHLASLKFLTLRPILGFTISEGMSSIRVRVEIQRCAFEACHSLLDKREAVWKKSMRSVMGWLRPEFLTSETRYGYRAEMDVEPRMEVDGNASSLRKKAGFDVASFYEAIKPSKEEPILKDHLADLLPKLRPYQQRAAHWMVQREKGLGFKRYSKTEFLSPLSMPVDLLDTSSQMYYNPFSGNISLKEHSLSDVRGGILADEMGLGKTVELLACIMAHRMPLTELGKSVMDISGDQGNNIRRLKKERVECICGAVSESSTYKGIWVQCNVCDAWQHADCVRYSAKRKVGFHICKLCSESSIPVATGATLIVCPTSTFSEWYSEIFRYTKPNSLKTCQYTGVKRVSAYNEPPMDVNELLSADIVLTTYDVLKNDLSHNSDRHEGDGCSMRTETRCPVIPSPLTRVYWWRLCLDEAQMVENNAAAATKMASQLRAKYRWCLTGAPIQRKLDDLYGLLKFLKASPFNSFRWWTKVIRLPYESGDEGAVFFTHKLFKRLMWRSSKVHIAEDLQLPSQEECVSWLSLSPIEEHFYHRQHETCAADASEVINRFKNDILQREATDLRSSDALADTIITDTEAVKLLNSLLKLRQACCHPQVVLIGKTKIEGEEALRKVVVALNALAGVAIVKKDYPQAVSLYTESLSLAEEHSEDLRMDPLLNIHLHHNLADIIPLAPDNLPEFQSLPRSFRGKVSDVEESDQIVVKSQNFLRRACEDLKQKYLFLFKLKLSVAQQEFTKSYGQVCKSFIDGKNQNTTWLLEALQRIEQKSDLSSEFIKYVGEAASEKLTATQSSSIASSVSALKDYIQISIDFLEESRKTLLDRLLAIDQTMGNPREEDIERVRYCRKCQANDDGPCCVHCELDELFQVYEARLFRLNKGNNGEVIRSSQEYYKNTPSEVESVLSIIKCKSGLLGKDGTSAATKLVNHLEAMRKEYPQARSLAIAQAQVLRAHDEINMATSRLPLKEDETDIAISALNPGELDAASAKYSGEKFLASSALSRIQGQLRYLKGSAQAKQRLQSGTAANSDLDQGNAVSFTTLFERENECLPKPDVETCPICQKILGTRKMVFQCGHVTCCKCLLAMTEERLVNHAKCQNDWIMCPTCRQHTNYQNIAFADDKSIGSRDPIKARENSEASITVRGSYSTKIEAVTRRILWISSTDPRAKILVYTSWNDVLDELEHALNANNITCIGTIEGRETKAALSHFRGQRYVTKQWRRNDGELESKNIQVLLLLLQDGAKELDLLEAQHVIFVEPLLNPAAEARAIGRVLRYKQKNKTFVHRFIVKDTVEESIYKMHRSRSAGFFICKNEKNQDQPVLKLGDVESLFRVEPSIVAEENPTGSLTHLSPAVAAELAAERRLMESSIYLARCEKTLSLLNYR